MTTKTSLLFFVGLLAVIGANGPFDDKQEKEVPQFLQRFKRQTVWKATVTAVVCGTSGSKIEKGSAILEALDNYNTHTHWIVHIQPAGKGAAWNGRGNYVRPKYRDDDVCGYFVGVWEDDTEEGCPANSEHLARLVQVDAHKQGGSLVTVNDNIKKKAEQLGLKVGLILTESLGDGGFHSISNGRCTSRYFADGYGSLFLVVNT